MIRINTINELKEWLAERCKNRATVLKKVLTPKKPISVGLKGPVEEFGKPFPVRVSDE